MNGDGHTTTSCTACSTTPGYPSGFTSGGTFSTSPTSAATASSACRYVAPDKSTPSNCSGISKNTVSYSGSAWGTNFYTVTSAAGKYITSNNNANPTCAAAGNGYYVDATNQTAQTQCPAGYRSGSDNGRDASTDCYVNTTAGSYVKTAKDATQTQCPANSYCVSTKVYYNSTGGSAACSGLGGGLYANSAAGSDAATDCYITIAATKYLPAQSSTAVSNCTANYYCPGGNFYYSSTATNQGRTACASPYSSSATSSDDANDCYLTTTAGKYVATAGEGETTCASNGYCAGGSTIYKGGSVSGRSTTGGRTACASPYSSAGTGQDDANDCYLTTTAGKYVATAGSGETACAAGGYCAGGSTIYKGGSVSGRSTTGGRTGCPTAYPSSATSSSKIGQCYLTLTAGKQVASAGAGSSNCSAGRYCTSTGNIYYNTDGGTATYTGTQCVAGSYSTAGASSCTACGNGKTSTAGATSSSSCTDCTAISGSAGWAATSWNTNNTMTNLCTTSGCQANYYKSGNSCPSCSSGTNSKYTKSSAGTTTVNNCYLTTTAGKYITSANAGTGTESACAAGSYCPGSVTIYYGGTHSSSHLTYGGSTACASPYSSSAASSDDANDCYLTTTAGKYVATAGAGETTCAENGYCPGGSDIYKGGSVTGRATTGGRTACTSPYSSAATGQDDANDCYLTTTATKYVATAGAGETTCVAGGYCAGGTTVYKGGSVSGRVTTGGMTVCADNTYSSAGASSCTACGTANGYHNTGTAASAHATVASCVATCDAGQYVATAGAGCISTTAGNYSTGGTVAQDATLSQTPCAAGTYAASGGMSACTPAAKGYYVSGTGKTAQSACYGGKYQDETGQSSCKSCPAAYPSGNYAITSINSCYYSCLGGTYYANANDGKCTDVGTGYYAAHQNVSYGKSGTRTACPSGMTTTGSGYGADEAADCGRVLKTDGTSVRLRQTKKTTPSLNVKIGDTTYYGNMSLVEHKTTAGSTRALRVKNNDGSYYVYDDTAQENRGYPWDATGFNINTNGTTYTYSAANMTWETTFAWGKVSGIAACNSTAGSWAVASPDVQANSGGTRCWCKMTNADGIDTSAVSSWVFYDTSSSAAACASNCAYYCGTRVRYYAVFRSGVFSAVGD